MRLTDFDASSFDCYGTLIDWETGLAAALGHWARRRGLELDDESLLASYATNEARAEADHPAERYPEILARALTDLGTELGAPVDDRDRHFIAGSVRDWPAFPDSADALRALGAHYRLIVLSNVDRSSFAASEERLGVRFDKVITAEDVGSYKPSKRNFEVLIEAAAALGVQRNRLLHVAQSLFHDHVPAKAAGLATVWINRRHARQGWGATPPPEAPVTPDWEFPSMAAFADACLREARGDAQTS